MAKASEIARQLSERVGESAGEDPRSSHPELRLRDGVMVAVDPSKTVSAALGEVQGNKEIAMQDPNAGSSGVLISTERYLELVGIELLHGPKQADASGRIYPVALDSSSVEQVDPDATWVPVQGQSY